jgi:hypothetical protein
MLMFTGYVFWTLADGKYFGTADLCFFFCLMSPVLESAVADVGDCIIIS